MPAPQAASLLVLDKPAGPTSFDLVREVRRATGVRKVGHAGTLDPFATGVLVLGLGPATRLLRFLSGGEKLYHLTVRFGVGTDSHDVTGEVVATGDPSFTEADLDRAVRAHEGEITQSPPSLSALRVDGERSYARHRRGETEDLPARPVVIHRIEVLAFARPDLTLRVRCGGGTYMRSLARDLGRSLGCPAHAAALRREAVGPFTLADAHAPEELARWPEGAMAPREIARGWPRLALDDEAVFRTRHGEQPPARLWREAGWTHPPERVALVDAAGDLVAVAEAREDDLKLSLVLSEDPGAGA